MIEQAISYLPQDVRISSQCHPVPILFPILLDYPASHLNLCSSFHKQPLSYFNPASHLVLRF